VADRGLEHVDAAEPDHAAGVATDGVRFRESGLEVQHVAELDPLGRGLQARQLGRLLGDGLEQRGRGFEQIVLGQSGTAEGQEYHTGERGELTFAAASLPPI
jgi:hypothetical protein